MRAETHTEVYRRFDGKLVASPFRPLVLTLSGIRLGWRRKLPALFLYLIPAIATIVTSFIVHLRFQAEKELEPGEIDPEVMIGMVVRDSMGEVETLILQLLSTVRLFALLAVAWYGSGLIAEDRRLKAHLLYFARPLTRWGYIVGKYGTACFWGACAIVTPVTIVCSVGAFASPKWSFLLDRWPLILKVELYAVLWVVVLASLVLAVSSLVTKRNQALAGVFGLVFLTTAAGEALAGIFDHTAWRLLSIWRNFDRVAEWAFEVDRGPLDWGVEASFWVLGGVVLACGLILARQVGRMEVHG